MAEGSRSVWVLTEGSYSDFSIRGVYSSEENARAVMAERKKTDRYCDFNDPEEWELDGDIEFVSGPIFGVYIELESGFGRRQEPRYTGHCVRHPERCNVTEPFGDGEKLSLFVASPISYEHAEKVAIEERQEWLRSRG